MLSLIPCGEMKRPPDWYPHSTLATYVQFSMQQLEGSFKTINQFMVLFFFFLKVMIPQGTKSKIPNSLQWPPRAYRLSRWLSRQTQLLPCGTWKAICLHCCVACCLPSLMSLLTCYLFSKACPAPSVWSSTFHYSHSLYRVYCSS